MNKEFKLPDVGEGLTEADIVTWRVKPGDVVTINQVIVEIETAKSLVELPSPFAGTVSRLLVDEGTTVDVGIPIIEISDGTDAPPAAPAQSAPAQAAPAAGGPAGESSPQGDTAAPERQPVLVGYGVRPGATARRPRRDRSTRPASYPASPSITDAPPAKAAPAAPPRQPRPRPPASRHSRSRRSGGWPATSAWTSPH